MSESFVSSLSSATPSPSSSLEAPVLALKNLATHRDVTATLSVPQAGVPDEDEILRDMTLPDDVKSLIEPVLTVFGLRLEVAERQEYPIEPSRVHVAVNGGVSLFLLHFKASILEDARWAKHVMLRGYLFRAGEQVRILSKDCKDLDAAFVLAWRVWSNKQIATEYVEWRSIAQLPKARENQRPDLLHQALRLPNTVLPRTTQQGPQDLLQDVGRFDRLVNLIAESGENAGMGSVDAFINDRLVQAALPNLMRLERAVWATNYPAGARAMISWLHAKGANPAREGYSCLASVLVTFLNRGPDDKQFLIETIGRYHLVSSNEELEALRKVDR